MSARRCRHPSVHRQRAGHTAEFREVSISPSGHAGLIKAVKVMAMTAIDLLASPELLQAVKAEFATAVERR
jgi:hypothetical protein